MQRGDDPAEGAGRLPPSRSPDRRASAVWQQRRGAHAGCQLRSQAEQDAPLHLVSEAQAGALRDDRRLQGSMDGKPASMDPARH
jgi:hypothetical protein